MGKAIGPATALLDAVARGERGAIEKLLPLVYDELRKLARARMAKLPTGQTLQPTALVHEALLRLIGSRDRSRNFENTRHFFFAAARAMHDILVEDARAKASLKRGGRGNDGSSSGSAPHRVPLSRLAVATDASPLDLLAIEEVLQEMKDDAPRTHQLVMLRFFAGLTCAEAAAALSVSQRTVEREWRYARARLHKALTVA